MGDGEDTHSHKDHDPFASLPPMHVAFLRMLRLNVLDALNQRPARVRSKAGLRVTFCVLAVRATV